MHISIDNIYVFVGVRVFLKLNVRGSAQCLAKKINFGSSWSSLAKLD